YDPILFNGHGREWIRFLENHSDTPAHNGWIGAGAVKIFALEQDAAFHPRVRDELMHAIKARRKVDFPQPLGPMIAVTLLGGISIVTSWMASFCPYQIERVLTSNAGLCSGAGADGEECTFLP